MLYSIIYYLYVFGVNMAKCKIEISVRITNQKDILLREIIVENSQGYSI
jgi:hypothetical protein